MTTPDAPDPRKVAETALDVFVYRFIGGLAFTVIYVLRGFGIVSWTHALYDVFVVLGGLLPG